jgi:hypothetical protein
MTEMASARRLHSLHSDKRLSLDRQRVVIWANLASAHGESISARLSPIGGRKKFIPSDTFSQMNQRAKKVPMFPEVRVSANSLRARSVEKFVD